MTEVLLVDDDGSVLITLAIALRRRGHRISVARDAIGALEYLRHNVASVVVSDVRMPGMNGFELAHRLHQLPHPPRVILTSAYSNMPALGEEIEAFVQKPIDIDILNSLLTEPRGDSESAAIAKLPSKSRRGKRARSGDACHPLAPERIRQAVRMPRATLPTVG